MVRMSAARTRSGMSDLVIALILVSFALVLGFMHSANVDNHITGYLEVMGGEVMSATSVWRGDELHVRVDFRHVIGPDFDRVAVSELVVGGSRIERDDMPLDTDYAALEYGAVGWGHDPTTCSPIVVDEKAWSQTRPAPPPCTIDVYQRVGDSDTRDGIIMSGGDTVALEFVMVGVDMPASTTLGVVVEYGMSMRTGLTDSVDVVLYHP